MGAYESLPLSPGSNQQLLRAGRRPAGQETPNYFAPPYFPSLPYSSAPHFPPTPCIVLGADLNNARRRWERKARLSVGRLPHTPFPAIQAFRLSYVAGAPDELDGLRLDGHVHPSRHRPHLCNIQFTLSRRSMEKKRKLPARAAARADHVSKKRNLTPPEPRSATPTSATGPEPEPETEPTPVADLPPPLPKSIQAGKPLPTVETAQAEDLPTKDFQSVSERFVSPRRSTRPDFGTPPASPYQPTRVILTAQQWCPRRITHPITSEMD